MTIVSTGQVQDFLVDSRPANLHFSQDNYNNSYDFGSFPGVTWNNVSGGENVSFAAADLSGGTFQSPLFQCDLSYANLTNTQWASGDDGRASLTSCTLAYADCSGAVFGTAPAGDPTQIGFVFSHLDCTGTIFRGCIFRNVEFLGGGFIGADFTGAQFINCLWMDQLSVGGGDGTVFWDSTTTWPAGFSTSVFPRSASHYHDFSNQTITPGTDLTQLFCGHANFENAVMDNIHLPYTCSFANFKGAKLLGYTFGTAVNTFHGVFQPTSYPLVSWADFTDATIDFGPLDYSSPDGGGGIVVPIATHANFTRVNFVWSGMATYGAVDMAQAWWDVNLAYAIFDYCTVPTGMLMFFIECNGAYASFRGSQLGPADHLVRAVNNNHRDIPWYTYGDTNFCYADFTGATGGWYDMCDLSYAKFVNAKMAYSGFSEAYIGYADFTGATLSQAGMTGAFSGSGTFQGVIPALYNSATKLPANINLSGLRPAITGQNDTRGPGSYSDGHQDFSHQTILPTSNNEPFQNGFLNAFGADFNHAHFLGATYSNIDAYNSNFQDCTFDAGFVFAERPGPSQSYQSHWGGPPSGVGVPRGASSSAGGPQRVWRVP